MIVCLSSLFKVKMITGDHKTIAIETARVLNMGTLIQGPQGLPVCYSKRKKLSIGNFFCHLLYCSFQYSSRNNGAELIKVCKGYIKNMKGVYDFCWLVCFVWGGRFSTPMAKHHQISPNSMEHSLYHLADLLRCIKCQNRSDNIPNFVGSERSVICHFRFSRSTNI